MLDGMRFGVQRGGQKVGDAIALPLNCRVG